MPAPDRRSPLVAPLLAPLLAPLALAGSVLAWPAVAQTRGPAPSPAAQQLSLHVELERQAPLTGGVERGQARLTQHLTLKATVRALGGPMAHNPLDPDDLQRQLADAQRRQQRVQAALATRPAPATMVMDPAAMQARAQQMMARCGEDRECLMREAAAMSAAAMAAQAPAGTGPGLQSRLQAYGQAAAACEHEGRAAARQACLDRARQAAGADDGIDPNDQDEDLPEPYRMYVGEADCGLQVQAVVDERIEGEFDDVQGRVPFTQTLSGRLDAPQPQLCPLLQVVLDTRNGRIWTRATQWAPDVTGVRERRERGRSPQRQDSRAPLDWREAGAVLQQRLLKLNANGRAEDRVPVAGGGQVVLRVSWRFAPV